MSYRLRITAEAEEHLAELDEWWTKNRKSATRLTDELSNVARLLMERPNIGLLHKKKGNNESRKIRLGRTPYYVFYSVEEEQGEILVLAIWSSMRDKGPPL